MEKINIELSSGNITKEEFINTIKEHQGYFFVKYNISDDDIITFLPHFSRNELLSHNLSERIVLYLLSVGYITENAIKNLSMNTYGNLSTNAIIQYKDYIDMSKLLIIKATTDTIDPNNMDLFVTRETTKSMWDIISSCQLSKEFLAKNVKNINWSIFITTNYISNDIRECFGEYIDAVDMTAKNVHAYYDKIMRRNENVSITDTVYDLAKDSCQVLEEEKKENN